MTNQNYPYSKSMLQWPTIKTATLDKSENKIEQPILQWPEKNFATPPKNIRNSQNKKQLKTYNKELSKFNGNTTVPEPTQEKLQTPKNKDEEQYKNWKQKYNQTPISKKFDESQNGPSSKGQGSIQNLEASKNRQTDKHPNIHMRYKESQRTQIIFEGKNAIPPIYYLYVKYSGFQFQLSWKPFIYIMIL